MSQNQIPGGHRRVRGSERNPVPGASQIGPADPDETGSVSIRVRRRIDRQQLPDLLPLALESSEEPRRYPSHAEFADDYGASQADLEQVEAFVLSHGLSITETSAARRTVFVTGTVRQLESAFRVTLYLYESPRGTYRGREGHVHVPENIADIVVGVFGLDNRGMAKRSGPRGSATAVPLTPQKVASLYEFPTGVSAAGQTIGLLEFWGPWPTGFRPADVAQFFAANDLPAPTITVVDVNGASNVALPLSGPEVVLDIDVTGAAAPGAAIVVYFSNWTEQGWHDVLTAAVYDTVNRPVALSISYGWSELEENGQLAWSEQTITAIDEIFVDATRLGITILVASGDSGSTCQIGDGKAHVLYPASSPSVTACGGTTIGLAERHDITAHPFSETVWNADLGNYGGWAATGGGISDVFEPQFWQDVPGVHVDVSVNDGHTGRGIPDIAGNADPASGYTIYFDHQAIVVGGTSAVAPLYAALIAILAANLGYRPGWLNPFLYSLTPMDLQTYVFRDITGGGGNNGSNAIIGSGTPGYTARVGWDACTGLGSIHGTHLLEVLREYGPPQVLFPPMPWPRLRATSATAGIAISDGEYSVLPGGFRIPVDPSEPASVAEAQELLASLLMRNAATSSPVSSTNRTLIPRLDALVIAAAERVGYVLPPESLATP